MLLFKEALGFSCHRMSKIVSQAKATLIIFICLACNIQFSTQKLVIKLERSIQPGLGESRLDDSKYVTDLFSELFYVPFKNVDKRGLVTYQTREGEEEKKENIKTKLAELVRLEDKLWKLWKELGDIELEWSIKITIHYIPPDHMIFCAKFTMCAIRFKKEFHMGNVSIFFFSSKQSCLIVFYKVSVDANLVQSLTITMARIREVTTKMGSLSKEIGVRVIHRGRIL